MFRLCQVVLDSCVYFSIVYNDNLIPVKIFQKFCSYLIAPCNKVHRSPLYFFFQNIFVLTNSESKYLPQSLFSPRKPRGGKVFAPSRTPCVLTLTWSFPCWVILGMLQNHGFKSFHKLFNLQFIKHTQALRYGKCSAWIFYYF